MIQRINEFASAAVLLVLPQDDVALDWDPVLRSLGEGWRQFVPADIEDAPAINLLVISDRSNVECFNSSLNQPWRERVIVTCGAGSNTCSLSAQYHFDFSLKELQEALDTGLSLRQSIKSWP